jgi:AraC-like DNA-binding protein
VSHYENHNLENEALPFICKEICGYPEGNGNWHENIEIICILNGEGSVIHNGESFLVSEGDIVIMNSNQLHGILSRERKLTFRYLIVDRSFCLSNGFDTNNVVFNTKVRDDTVFSLMLELAELYAEDKDIPYRVPTIRYTVLKLVLLLIKKYSIPADGVALSERSANYVKHAIEYIRASFDKDISLDDVAEFVGVNKCYLSREFHKFTGYPFVEYLNRLRCKAAQKLLEEGKMNVCEIGAVCGFQNKSYFAKIFRRYVGISPGEYRTSHAKKTVSL